MIPKIIWTYWDEYNLTPFIKLCIKSWKKNCKNYKINIINKKTINKYITINNYNIEIDSPARLSDLLRLKLLSEYGGIWMDISIYLTENIDNIINKYSNYDIIGFDVPSNVFIMESWFIAASKNNNFIKDWFNLFSSIKNKKDFFKQYAYLNRSNYIKSFGDYLLIHLCFIILTENNNNINIKLLDSNDGPFYYHNLSNWDSLKISNYFINILKNKTFDNKYLIKFRGDDRNIITEKFTTINNNNNILIIKCIILFLTIFIILFIIYKNNK